MAMFRTEAKRGPLMRVSYAFNLQKGREQKKDDGTTKTEYGCTLILPKSDTAGMAWLQGMVAEAVVGEWGEKGKDRFKAGLIRNPIIDGAAKEAYNKTTGQISPGLGPDVVFIRAKSNDKVPIFDQRKIAATLDDLLSGYWVYPVLNIYAWHNPKNGDGVSFGVNMVQIAKKDEVLGGGGFDADPDKFFETIQGDDAPPAGAAKDASGMFG
jgi:hypothetical protein